MSDNLPEDANNDDAGMWTLAEASQRTRLSSRTLLRAMHAGKLPAYKPVGRILLDPVEVKAWAKGTAWEPGSAAA